MTAQRSRHAAALAALTVSVLTVTATACSSTPHALRPYDRAPVPAVPDRTHEVAAAWVDSNVGLADGQYWASDAHVDADRLVFTLEQAFFGPACAESLGADECMSDYGVLDEPTGELTADPTAITVASVVADDQRNFSVPATELVNLLGGGSPDPAAPTDYQWVDFPFLLTVRNGAVTEARQIWVP